MMYMFFKAHIHVVRAIPVGDPPHPAGCINLLNLSGMQNVIVGMDRGVEGMRIGGSREIAIPAALG